MTVRSIIDLDIRDDKFKQFAATWEKFQTQLSKTPSMWERIGKSQSGVASNLKAMTAAMAAQHELTDKHKEDDTRRFNQLKSTEHLWNNIGRHSTLLYRNVIGIGQGMLRWGSLAVGGATALAMGTFMGMDRTARDVSAQRQAAKGLGTDIGTLQGFQKGFGRVLSDPQGFLGGVRTMEANYGARTPWYGVMALAGMAGRNMTGNTATDSLAFLNAEYRMAHKVPLGMLGIYADKFGLNLDDLMKMRGTPISEWAQMNAVEKQTAARANIPDKVAKTHQDFATRVAANHAAISAAWDKRVAQMLPAMGKFSDSLTAFTVSFFGHPLNTLLFGSGGAAGIATRQDFLKDPTMSKWLRLAAESDKTFGLPAGTLERMKFLESGNMLSGVPASRAGALGIMQLMPATARALGVDPNDPLQSLYGAGVMMQGLMRKYGGDVSKAMAAYNWGSGNLDRDIARHGSGWRSYLPAETANYIGGTHKVSNGRLEVMITNATGGNTVVSVNGLAGGQ